MPYCVVDCCDGSFSQGGSHSQTHAAGLLRRSSQAHTRVSRRARGCAFELERLGARFEQVLGAERPASISLACAAILLARPLRHGELSTRNVPARVEITGLPYIDNISYDAVCETVALDLIEHVVDDVPAI